MTNFCVYKFSNTFLENLNQYRKEKKLTDVELRIGDELFPAHRNVLSIGSPVLEAAFSESWTQTKIYPLTEHVDPSIVEPLLNFFYTGSIDLTPDNVYPVCVAAHFLQITTLLDECVKELSKQVTIENIFILYGFSISHELEVLLKSCLEFISTNSSKVLNDPQILEFSTEDFKHFIARLKEHFTGSFEAWRVLRVNTFHCIVRWTEENLAERLDELPELLKNIPLEELTSKFLSETVSVHPLVKESFPCIEALEKALKSFTSDSLIPSPQDMIVIGGRNSSDEYASMMIYYHADTQTWTRLPDMLQKREMFAVAVNAQRDIFVSGGIVHNDRGWKKVNSVEMFTWKTQKWRNLKNMPESLQNHSMAIHDGHLYAAGGLRGGSPSMNVWRYSFQEQRWDQVKSHVKSHYDGCPISYKDYLYLISTYSVERYDPAKDEWTVMASMKTAITSVRAAVHQDKIYAAGGKRKSRFEVYDPETDAWTALPVPPIEGSRSLVSPNGKLLAVCDHKESGHSIYEYDLSNEQWTKFAVFPSYMFPHHVVVGHYN